MNMGSNTADEILNLDEASRYLRIKPRTLYSLAARGIVPAAKIGGQWRFLRSQLDGLFEAGRRVPAEQGEGSMRPAPVGGEAAGREEGGPDA
jgi:excisionase family DNA binding protein